ncbi:MAG: response regulator [Legionella sp.]
MIRAATLNGKEPKLLGKNGEKKLHPTPKIIILDLNMPKMNGIEFMKSIRANNQLKSLLIFVLTTHQIESKIK